MGPANTSAFFSVERRSSSVRPGLYLHPSINDLAYWTKRLQQAERELEAATRRSDVNAAASRLMRVKAELKALEQ
jgi:hypothetical protein